jgi:flagellar biosynthesis/type III secretory pathway protein FliH
MTGHTCVSRRGGKPSLKPQLAFGTCPKCRKRYGANPLLHVCEVKSDFRKRKAEYEKKQREAAREKARKEKPRHDYTECSNRECKRSLCVAYKAGIEKGEQRGIERGWQAGYDRGRSEAVGN